jgi:hypothetical protein
MQGHSKLLSGFPFIGHGNLGNNLESHYMHNQPTLEISPYGFLLSARRSANYRRLCRPFTDISLIFVGGSLSSTEAGICQSEFPSASLFLD